ncbi:MAG: DNA polymerase IV [Thermoproteota archaeon]
MSGDKEQISKSSDLKPHSYSRVIMLVDLDYFFAQCEEVRNPSLKNKPVVVCVYSGRGENSGVVSTANYAARKYGVKSGIPISVAKRMLKGVEAFFLPADHEDYARVSNGIMNILRKHADFFEQAGIDEAYLDVSKSIGDFDKAIEVAKIIKEEIKKNYGITCSIGIGPNKLIAKIAADVQKPDGLTVVKPDDVQSFLSPLPVGRLIGIGNKTESIMRELGIKTIGDLAKYDVQKLINLFGEKLGVYFHKASLGIDDRPIKEKREAASISRISTLKKNTRRLEEVVEKADQLCNEIHSELVQRGLKFKHVTAIVIMEDISIHSKMQTLTHPTNNLEDLRKNVRRLLEKLMEESELEIRRVGVKVSGFVKEGFQKQLRFFE